MDSAPSPNRPEPTQNRRRPRTIGMGCEVEGRACSRGRAVVNTTPHGSLSRADPGLVGRGRAKLPRSRRGIFFAHDDAGGPDAPRRVCGRTSPANPEFARQGDERQLNERRRRQMNANDIVVRFAVPKDSEAIVAMARELAAAVEDPPPRIDVAQFLDIAFGPERWCDCFVAERGSALVGYAVVCRGFEAHTGERRLWLADLFVSGATRMGGVGRALIGAVASHALALGCAAVCWDLWRPNTVGRAFYRALGAEEASDLAQYRLGRERLAALAR
jgi:GNAT superfamily N-acetyltransferase